MKGLSTVIASIIALIIGTLSPEIRKAIQDFIKDLYVKVKETANPFDDLAVKVLAGLFAVNLDE